jgi:carbon storage regulator
MTRKIPAMWCKIRLLSFWRLEPIRMACASSEKEFEMLVLSRKIDEKLLLNGNIEVRIVSIKHGRVRLGIEAPRHISIERPEACHSTEHALAEMCHEPVAG